MTRKLKALGLALFAVFALSAVSASAASAVTHHFDTNVAGEELSVKPVSATQTFYTTTSDPNTFVKCTNVTGTGTLPATTNTQVTTTPNFSGCKVKQGSSSELNGEITENNCHFTFTGETTTDVTGNQSATVHISNCGEDTRTHTHALVVDATGLNLPCVEVPEQSVEGVQYVDDPENSGNAVIAKAKVHGIHSTTVGACESAPVTHNDGLYEGEVTVSGKNGGRVFLTQT